MIKEILLQSTKTELSGTITQEIAIRIEDGIEIEIGAEGGNIYLTVEEAEFVAKMIQEAATYYRMTSL